ncbi:hypothetical protein ABEW34_11075 [Paenibacillus algorifonticola]|uniref:hypothetical protein n=1 Tax=Paenibacillus algorifonticola TaxID=684063 RepID=UPI003D2C5117
MKEKERHHNRNKPLFTGGGTVYMVFNSSYTIADLNHNETALAASVNGCRRPLAVKLPFRVEI